MRTDASVPKAILFDLDDTLISAYAQPDSAWLAVSTELAATISPLTANEVASAVADHARLFWADPNKHRQHRQDMRAARRLIVIAALTRLGADRRCDFGPEVAAALADRYTDYRDEHMHLFPGAHATLDALRAMDVRLALLTNGAGPSQREKIDRFQLAHRFHHIQIEGEHGFGKPEEQAYRHALAALGVGVHEAWIVGDNLEWEVAAPQKIGIYAIWHDPAGGGLPAGSTVKPDRTITRLEQLLESSSL